MSTILQFVINRLVSLLTDPSTFNKIRGLVEQANNENLSGPEKKEAVIESAKKIGIELSSWLFNLLIELAVTFLKSKQGKL